MAAQEFRVVTVGGQGHYSLASEFGKGFKLAAVAGDGLDDTARAISQRPYAQGVPYYEDFAKMLDEVPADVLYVAAWPAQRGRYILAALERGMHVITDKPIANSDAELEKIRALTQQKSLHLLAEYTMRGGAAYQAARAAVQAGRIGEPVLIFGQKSYKFRGTRPDYYKTRKGYPGTIMFVGCHVMDLAWWVSGLDFATVEGGTYGNLAKKDYGEFDDHAAVLLTMRNGATALMSLDYLRPDGAPTHGDDRIRIAGSQGVIEVRDNKCVLLSGNQPPAELADGGENRELGKEYLNVLRTGQGMFSTAGSLYMARVMLKSREAVESGKRIVL